MRVLRLTTNYSLYLKHFIDRHPGFHEKCYANQHAMLMGDCYGWANFYTHSLGKLGYEVWEPVGNFESMQKRWALENGVDFDEDSWLWDIATAQVKKFQPDVLLVNDYSTYALSFFSRLRETCPSVRLVIGWCGAPYLDESVFKAYDLVISNIPGLVKKFKARGHRSAHMRHAFEPKILEKTGIDEEREIGFSFIGSIATRANFHGERECLLKRLAEDTDIQMWLHISQPSELEMVCQQSRQRKFDFVQKIKKIPGGLAILRCLPGMSKYLGMKKRPTGLTQVDRAVISRGKNPLFGLAMYQALGSSKVTLNTHIDLSAQYASNMRLFEATGMGACLLTDWKPDLSEIFEPDEEVVSYRNAEEAVDKVRYLLSHEETRKSIAKKGQLRTLRDHTYDIRACQLDEIIKKRLSIG